MRWVCRGRDIVGSEDLGAFLGGKKTVWILIKDRLVGMDRDQFLLDDWFSNRPDCRDLLFERFRRWGRLFWLRFRLRFRLWLRFLRFGLWLRLRLRFLVWLLRKLI